MADIEQVDIEEFAIRLAALTPVIDVREVDEYREAHVPGAILIPLVDLRSRLTEVPGGPVLVICRSGNRSQRGCELLASHGIEAANVTGGTLAWIESGRETVSGLERG